MSTVVFNGAGRPHVTDRPVIAVVGAGAAGTSFLHSLVKQLSACPTSVPPRVVVFEPRSRPGPGLAYGADCCSARLNRPVSVMSIDYTDPGHFHRWLARHGQLAGAPGTDELFAARSSFGDYLAEMFQRSCHELTGLGGNVDVLPETAVAVHHCPKRKFVVETGRSVLSADDVVLCLGSLPAQPPYRLEHSAGYIAHPYPLDQTLTEIPDRSRVLVLGTGLSAVDVALQLGASGTREVVLASRRGLLPDVRCDLSTREAPQLLRDLRRSLEEHRELSLRRLFELVDEELRRCGTSLHAAATPLAAGGRRGVELLRQRLADPAAAASLQQCVVALTSMYSQMWRGMGPRARTLFLRRFQGPFAAVRSPMPPTTARRLLALADSGELAVRRGIRSVHPEHGHLRADFVHDPPMVADAVVNATGRVTDVAAANSGSLLDQLVRSGLARPHPLGGLDVAPDTNEVHGAYEQRHGLRVVGDLASGVHFHTSSMEYVATQAAQVAEQIVSGSPSMTGSVV